MNAHSAEEKSAHTFAAGIRRGVASGARGRGLLCPNGTLTVAANDHSRTLSEQELKDAQNLFSCLCIVVPSFVFPYDDKSLSIFEPTSPAPTVIT